MQRYVFLTGSQIIREGDEMQYSPNDSCYHLCDGFVGKRADSVDGFPQTKVRRPLETVCEL
jgi:hypothetical protein